MGINAGNVFPNARRDFEIDKEETFLQYNKALKK